jgi:MtrB/PioB family decaheme-associated outer membrane protein
MAHERVVRFASGALVALAGLVAVLPAAALPPEENQSWVELGAWVNNDDSYKFGDFTGLEEKGISLLANFDVSRRAVWDSGDVRWWRAQGQNLGLDSRWARGDFGYQGLFDVWFEYEEIPKFQTDSAITVFQGRGTDRLTLRPSWVASSTTAGFSALAENERDLDIEHMRRDVRAGFGLDLPADLEWVGDYEYETKKGRKVAAALIGNTGGNPRTSLVAEPLDYQTNEGRTALRWNGERVQLQLGYEISVFNDSNDSLTWQNPFSQVGGWQVGAGVGYPTGFGRKATPPDNSFNQVSMAGGVDLPWNTRISGDAAFGWMRQNADFLPYTVNPLLDAAVPPPRGDADAGIDTTAATLRLASRPIDHLRIDANVRYDDRDNTTPRDVYLYVSGDSLSQQGIGSDRARLNLPNSYQLVEGGFEAGYEFFERTELSVGYQRQEIERTYTEVDQTTENTYEAALRSRPLSWLLARVEGSYADRNGTEYMYRSPLFGGFTPEYVGSITDPDELFENNPLLRKNNFADRKRSRVLGRIDLMPIDALSIGLDGAWVDDDYDQSTLGLTQREALSSTIDLSWTPIEILTTYVWFTYENLKSDVDGRSFSNAAQSSDPERDWFERDEDHVYTAGVGAELHLFDERLRLRADYVYSMANTDIEVGTGPALTPTSRNFPDVESRLHDFNVSAEYQFRENLAFRVSYLVEDLKSDDWAINGVAPDTISQVLGLGEDTPHYRNHLVGFAVRYEFR